MLNQSGRVVEVFLLIMASFSQPGHCCFSSNAHMGIPEEEGQRNKALVDDRLVFVFPSDRFHAAGILGGKLVTTSSTGGCVERVVIDSRIGRGRYSGIVPTGYIAGPGPQERATGR